MPYSTVDIKKLLKNYNFFKIQIATGTADDITKNEIEFLDTCIAVLSMKDKNLILDVYYYEFKRRDLARKLYCTERTIYRSVEKIIRLLTELFNSKNNN